MRTKRVLWVFLCLIAGGPCAFIALEGIGIPLVVLVLVGLISIGLRRKMVPETLLGFGLSYAAVALHFALPDAAASADTASRVYFVVQAVVAAAIPLAGLGLLVGAPGIPPLEEEHFGPAGVLLTDGPRAELLCRTLHDSGDRLGVHIGTIELRANSER